MSSGCCDRHSVAGGPTSPLSALQPPSRYLFQLALGSLSELLGHPVASMPSQHRVPGALGRVVLRPAFAVAIATGLHDK